MQRTALPLRLDWPAVASLLVNGLIVLALLGLQTGREAPSATAPTVTVVSLATPKGSEQGPEDAEAVAEPEVPLPAATPPPAETVSSQPQQPIAQAVTLPVALASSATAVPVSAAPVPAASATVQVSPSAGSAASAGAASRGVRKGVADGLDVKAPAGTSRSYAARVRSWLYAHKTYPRRSRMRREEGLVQVRFVLDREGVLLESAVTRKSGHEALDQEAQAMMQRSSPYPRAPVDLAGDRIEFTAPIEFALPL